MNETQKSVEQFSSNTLMKLISCVAFISTGIVQNAYLIYLILLKMNKIYLKPMTYLFSLCVCDILFCSICLPVVLSVVINQQGWLYGQLGCKLYAFANVFLLFGGHLTTFVMSIDRYIYTCHWKFYCKRFHLSGAIVSILVAWLIAFLLAFPPVFEFGSYDYIPVEGQCSLDHRFYTDNDTLGYLMLQTAACVTCFFVYSKIFLYLRNHRKLALVKNPNPLTSDDWSFHGPVQGHQVQMNNQGQIQLGMIRTVTNNGAPFNNNPTLNANYCTGSDVRAASLKLHLTRLYFLMTLIYYILWAPYIVKSFWKVLSSSKPVNTVFESVATWLVYCHPALLPSVYFVNNTGVKKRRIHRHNLIEDYANETETVM